MFGRVLRCRVAWLSVLELSVGALGFGISLGACSSHADSSPSRDPDESAPIPRPSTPGSNAPTPSGSHTDEEEDTDDPMGPEAQGHTESPTEDTFISESDVEVVIEGGESVECERQIEFGAVDLGDPLPFDVVIVADHSESLSWSRDDLSSGLAELLQDVRGRDVNFYLLTPTQYGESSAAANLISSDLVEWRDPVSGEPYTHAMTTYSQHCTDLDGVSIECPERGTLSDVPFRLEGQFDFVMPLPVAAITRDMTDTEVADQQAAISEGILQLGLGGSPYEQVACTLGRYISQAPELLPERVVFVILSDEDDETSPMDCLTGLSYERRRGDQVVGCTSDCNLHRYQVTGSGGRFSTRFMCVPVDDLGVPHPELGRERGSTDGQPIPSCDGVTTRPCSESEVTVAARSCNPSERVESCERSCRDVESTCTLDLEDLSVDACSESFVHAGRSYQNVVDYCTQNRQVDNWSGCTRTAQRRSEGTGNWTGSMSPRRLVSGQQASDLIRYFQREAAAHFGSERHFVEVIGFAPEFSCQPQAGQSYATQLASLATSEADVFPICESYAPALQRIHAYAQQLLQTEYRFELGERETIEAVVVTDLNGKPRTLSARDYTYDAVALRLNPDAITSRDRQLTVEVMLHCTTVVR